MSKLLLSHLKNSISIRVPSYISVFVTSPEKFDLTLCSLLRRQSFRSNIPLTLNKVKRTIDIGEMTTRNSPENQLKKKTFLGVYLKKVKVSPKDFSYATTKVLLRKAIKSFHTQRRISLLLVGVGFRFSLNNTCTGVILQLRLGYSHQIFIQIPPEINIVCIGGLKLILSGSSAAKVNLLAAFIRSQKVPDCYKGKGIYYEHEKIQFKDGKSKV